MANWLQRALYNVSNAVPLALMTALVWLLEFKTWRVPVVLFAVAIAVTVLFAISFHYGKKNCSMKIINVSKVVAKDSVLLAYVAGYILPFAYMVISDYNIVSLIVAILMLALVILPAIMALPNILLFFVGYHFYELETETGVGDYMLVSKRQRIRNKHDIKTVMRVFERLLIDTKGAK